MEKGLKIIHVQSSASDKRRAMLPATVTMAGELLFPFSIFKSKKDGQIDKMEIPALSPMCLYVIQKNYYFLKFPFNAKDICFKFSRYHSLKKDQLTIWPGGRRATLSSGVV